MKNFIIWLLNLFKKKEQNETIEEVSENVNETENNNETNTIEDMSVEKYNDTVIILDNGHAKSTPGKRSPIFDDGKTQFFEYEFNRDIVKRISEKLEKLGIKYYIIVPELEEDIKLTKRANRANEICKKYGAGKCLLISVHANAAGNGKTWMKGRGWSVYTTKGVTKSDKIATIFYEEAEKLLPKYNMTLRKDMSDGDTDYEENFTIIYAALCPAILTENLFYDNKIDVDFLMSEEGRNVIADIHVNAIKRICLIK